MCNGQGPLQLGISSPDVLSQLRPKDRSAATAITVSVERHHQCQDKSERTGEGHVQHEEKRLQLVHLRILISGISLRREYLNMIACLTRIHKNSIIIFEYKYAKVSIFQLTFLSLSFSWSTLPFGMVPLSAVPFLVVISIPSTLPENQW